MDEWNSQSPNPPETAHPAPVPPRPHILPAALERGTSGAKPGRWRLWLLGAFVALLAYYGLGALIIDKRHADVSLAPAPLFLPAGGSSSIGMMAALMDREVNGARWTPNDRFYMPSALLSRMPAWQNGVQQVVLAVAQAYAQGPAPAGVALAAENLATPPTWGWWRSSWPFFGRSAESAYREAIEGLSEANQIIAADALGYDNTGATLARSLAILSVRMDVASAEIALQVDGKSARENALAYEKARGAAYAAAMMVRALRADHPALVRDRQLGAQFDETQHMLDKVAVTKPWRVDHQDLVEQGYYVLRAKAALGLLAARSYP